MNEYKLMGTLASATLNIGGLEGYFKSFIRRGNQFILRQHWSNLEYTSKPMLCYKLDIAEQILELTLTMVTKC